MWCWRRGAGILSDCGPLVCDHGFRQTLLACVKIACRAGYWFNDDNK
jgi:hypothetical protein